MMTILVFLLFLAVLIGVVAALKLVRRGGNKQRGFDVLPKADDAQPPTR